MLQLTFPEALKETFLLLAVLTGLCFTFGFFFLLFLKNLSSRGRLIALLMALLPLAWPSLNLAFLLRSALSYTGPIPTFLRSLGLTWAEAPPLWGTSFTLFLNLFPYVVMSCFLALRTKEKSWDFAATHFRLSNAFLIRKFIFPTSLPYLGAGTLAVLFEALSDFGASSTWNLSTLSTTLVRTWFSLFSLEAAKLFAFGLMVVSVSIFAAEKLFPIKSEKSQFPLMEKRKLPPFFTWLGAFLTLMICTFGFLLPLLELLRLADWSRWDTFMIPTINTMAWTLLFSVLVATLSLGQQILSHLSPRDPFEAPLQTLKWGYALPGTLLAVSALPVLTLLRNSWNWPETVVFGTGLVWFYWVKFNFLSSRYLENHFRSLTENQKLLVQETSPLPTLTRWWIMLGWAKSFYFPIVGILLVDISKELPLILMLRPAGFHNLMTRSYDFISEGFWNLAALPSLILLGFGLLGIFFVLISLRRNSYDTNS
ncbi:MAG: hypothetical protein LW875_10070 [Proteobacteria bacterium]|nr:hypothetical protein [Pseudomonadota bacterium]